MNTLTADCTREALEFIRSNKDKPFFIYYPMALVHAPFVDPPSLSEPTQSKDKDGIIIRHELGRYTRYGVKEEEFYDTTQDAHEWTNQIGNPEYAATVKKLRTLVPSFETAAKPLPTALTEERRETQKGKKEKKRDKKKTEPSNTDDTQNG